jgi:hypothetical protein
VTETPAEEERMPFKHMLWIASAKKVFPSQINMMFKRRNHVVHTYTGILMSYITATVIHHGKYRDSYPIKIIRLL